MPDQPNIDSFELMALDLETAQQIRYRRAQDKEGFFDEIETPIFEHIKDLRNGSTTFHPSNQR